TEDAPAQAQVEEEGAVTHAEIGNEKLAEHVREEKSQRGASSGDQEAFGEQVADEAKPRRTESDAHGDFTLTGRGPREHQTREIGAGDEKDQSGGGEEQNERL